MNTKVLFFLSVLMAARPGTAGSPLKKSWQLSGNDRKCLEKMLSEINVDIIPMTKRDAFALSDPHTGSLLWLKNHRVLARKAYQPGSVFKIITAYAALSEGRVDPDRIFVCQGAKTKIGPSHAQVECWLHAGHGPVNLSKALALSCNLYFAELGKKIGSADILSAARDFGLGYSSGSDIGGEISGWLPSVATSDDAARLATGQGKEVMVTPLQMLGVIAAIANDGLLLAPRIRDVQSNKVIVRGQLKSTDALRFLRGALEEASAFGTGSNQKLGDLRLAGKTGTSAWLKKKWKTHAWYIGFAPYRHPLVALVVFVHDGQGSKEAAAIARKVMEKTYDCMVACGVLTSKP